MDSRALAPRMCRFSGRDLNLLPLCRYLCRSRSPTTGTICLQQRAAERQNIVSLSIALVLYYLDNMCSMLLCSPKTSKAELRDVCVVGGCYKGGLWPEWMASPTLSGQPQVARGFKKHELSNPRSLLKLSKLWNWMSEARHAEHAAILKTLRSATLCPFTTLVTHMT